MAGGLPGAVRAQPAADPAVAEDALLKFSGVEFSGVDERMEASLRKRVSLARLKVGTGLRPSRFRYFLQIMPREVDEALHPFGYYSSVVDVRPRQQGDQLGAAVAIELGDPVRVRIDRLAVDGDGARDRALRRAIAGFEPGEGDVLDHVRYEESKSEVNRLLGERGYFDASLARSRVEVVRARGEASLDLFWESGPRYRFGDTRFEGSQFRQGLLEPLVPYRAQAPYRQSQLLVLQQRLTDLDYFDRIDVLPRLKAQPERPGDAERELAEQVEAGPPTASADSAGGEEGPPRVGVDVTLEPAPRNVYRAGLSYGTDTGPGVKLGYTRRWLNDRGHRLESDLLLGGERSSALVRYRIPAFERLTGWWTARVAAREELFLDERAEIFESSLIRDGRWRGNLFGVGMVVQKEQYDSVGALLVYPQVSLERSVSNDPLYPTRGFKWSVLGRWGLTGLGSEVRFRQVIASATLIRGLGERTRVIVRGEAGALRTGEFQRIPPSLRFYAGGDRSVRGYGYQELAPPLGDGERFGGRNLLVGSVELEHMFTAQWGAAVFADAGNAYGSEFEPAVGVGLGLRWRSPVGPVQVDIGRGLDQPDKTFRLHIQLGPPL
nr:autotransporter assembly complex family protein [Lysobacter sp. CAU 1642]